MSYIVFSQTSLRGKGKFGRIIWLTLPEREPNHLSSKETPARSQPLTKSCTRCCTRAFAPPGESQFHWQYNVRRGRHARQAIRRPIGLAKQSGGSGGPRSRESSNVRRAPRCSNKGMVSIASQPQCYVQPLAVYRKLGNVRRGESLGMMPIYRPNQESNQIFQIVVGVLKHTS